VTGDWRRLQNEELHHLYASPNIIRVMRWEGHAARLGEMRNACKIIVGKLKVSPRVVAGSKE
jgi:hypothetical protein